MDDLISRQAAIEAVYKCDDIFAGDMPVMVKADAYEALAQLPSADAVEVVRCKDCRWWDKSEDSPFGYCMAMKHGYMSANWEIGIYRKYKGDFYCADGERDKE